MIGWTVLFATSVPVGYGEDGIPLFGPATWPGFIASLVIIGMGTGGIKSLVSPFCADQIPAGNQAKVVNGQTGMF